MAREEESSGLSWREASGYVLRSEEDKRLVGELLGHLSSFGSSWE